MPTFQQFATRCKARHDFSDQIQVRYRHTDGEDYDTWVSGEEVEQRLRSESREQQLRNLTKLKWDEIKAARERLPEEGKKQLRDRFRDRLGGLVEDSLGDNVVGRGLADRVSGRERPSDPYQAEKQQWQAKLQHDIFRAKVLELAWIQLEGSFPEEDLPSDFDDWV